MEIELEVEEVEAEVKENQITEQVTPMTKPLKVEVEAE